MKRLNFFVAAIILFLFAPDGFSAEKREMKKDYPFIFGAQYYRAPTPAPENWEYDLKRIAESGFTDVKFWLQWRWSHVGPDEYYYGDLDELMQLAQKYGLRVTINAIFDVAPLWLYEKYPDAKQVMNNGRIIEPYAVGHRQLGGHPGPCYNHPGALEERRKFFRNAIEHFSEYDNLVMWDVWNEPELSFPQRDADLQKLACYCDHCRAEFLEWLKAEYATVEELNRIWGRCYRTWEDVELPRNTQTVKDFIDWREFQGATMMDEAKWRLAMVRELDPGKVTYLHVVPNTMEPFNAVSTCMDDFEVAQYCDVFAATMNNGPFFTPQVVSAGKGKICYNVESHINGGQLSMHQPVITMNDLLNDFLPQVGMGIKGFLFWQYRAETLGLESPAWGLVNTDGFDREVTRAARTFWDKVKPHTEKLMRSFPDEPQVAVWKSRKNEIFHYCLSGNFTSLAGAVNAYATYLYNNNYNYRFVDSEGLDSLQGIKLLVMPSCYYLTGAEAEAVDRWVRGGGILLAEAHLGAYSDDTGRHSTSVPGFGLAEKWGIREVETSSTYRLRMDEKQDVNVKMADDVQKMLRDFGTTGGQFVPVAMQDGSVVWGSGRFARVDAPDAEALGYFSSDFPTIVKKELGKGTVYYCGTNIGEGAARDRSGFDMLFGKVLEMAEVDGNLGVPAEGVRMEPLFDEGRLNFIVVRNLSGQPRTISPPTGGAAEGLFSGKNLKGGSLTIEPGFCDIFIVN